VGGERVSLYCTRRCVDICLPFSFPILGLLYRWKFVTLLLPHTPNSQSDFNNTFVRSLYAFIRSHQLCHPARHFSRGRLSSYSLLRKSSPCKYLPIYHESVYTTFYFRIYTTKCRRPVKLSEVYRLHNSYKPVFTIALIRNINTLWTGDADLRLYITTVQDGWCKSAFLTRAWFPRTIHLITQYMEHFSEWSQWRMFIRGLEL